MHSFPELTHFAGFDWAKDHHDAVILDRTGATVASFTFAHSAQGWARWRERIKSFPALAVAIETCRGAAVEQLLQSGVAMFALQPLAAQRYRDRHVPSGSKSDRTDAWCCADALPVDGQHWRAFLAQDPLVEELRLLCRDEVELITQRTALEAFDHWTEPYTWAFIEWFPTAQELVKSTAHRRWVFLHKDKLWRPQTVDKRQEIFARADQFCSGAAVTRAKSRLALSTVQLLQTLHKQLDAYRVEIERLFAQHPDHDLFGRLPGAGDKLAPRLLSEVGGERGEYPDAQSLPCVAGTAPVSFQSGQMDKARIRWHCNRHLRHSVHLWADCSRKFCGWAQTYYAALRAKGKSHACALRCLGPALAENPLEEVAEPNALRRDVAPGQPAKTRQLAVAVPTQSELTPNREQKIPT